MDELYIPGISRRLEVPNYFVHMSIGMLCNIIYDQEKEIERLKAQLREQEE